MCICIYVYSSGQIVSTDQISLYYEKLTEKMKELELSKRPYDIWLLEETQCEIFTNLSEKEIVTVIGCASCTGDVKPPMLTFKGTVYLLLSVEPFDPPSPTSRFHARYRT